MRPLPRAGRKTGRGLGSGTAFTLFELSIALGIAMLVIAGAMTFIAMASRSVSGITAQTFLNDRVSHASAFIFSRVRLATSSSTDASGTTLTLGFDDDYRTDTDKDKNLYNDRDHFEIFQFVDGDGKEATLADNKLIYKARSHQAETTVLLPSGVRKLPGWNIFSVTNAATVLLHFGVADDYDNDRYQACDIQTALVPRNRPVATNLVTILP